jgi:hypothetical protein
MTTQMTEERARRIVSDATAFSEDELIRAYSYLDGLADGRADTTWPSFGHNEKGEIVELLLEDGSRWARKIMLPSGHDAKDVALEAADSLATMFDKIAPVNLPDGQLAEAEKLIEDYRAARAAIAARAKTQGIK